MHFDFDALIIGAGPAGLTAAMALGRLFRKVLMYDDNRPRNYSSKHLINFPNADGVTNVKFRDKIHANLKKYQTIEFQQGSVLSVRPIESGFECQFSTGAVHKIRKVLLAYGHEDRLPKIDGFKELWGKSVFQCPYCHGFDYQNKALGLFANGEPAFQALIMLSGLSPDLALFTNGKSQLSIEQYDILRRKKIEVFEKKISRLSYVGEYLKDIIFEDSTFKSRDALFITPSFPLIAKSDIGATLGCQADDFGAYKIDDRGRTSIPGVYAAGDMVDAIKQTVLLACASGQTAAMGIVYDLLAEDLLR